MVSSASMFLRRVVIAKRTGARPPSPNNDLQLLRLARSERCPLPYRHQRTQTQAAMHRITTALRRPLVLRAPMRSEYRRAKAAQLLPTRRLLKRPALARQRSARTPPGRLATCWMPSRTCGRAFRDVVHCPAPFAPQRPAKGCLASWPSTYPNPSSPFGSRPGAPIAPLRSHTAASPSITRAQPKDRLHVLIVGAFFREYLGHVPSDWCWFSSEVSQDVGRFLHQSHISTTPSSMPPANRHIVSNSPEKSTPITSASRGRGAARGHRDLTSSNGFDAWKSLEPPRTGYSTA